MSEVRGLNASIRASLKEEISTNPVWANGKWIRTEKGINKLSNEDRVRVLASEIDDVFSPLSIPQKGQVFRQTEEGLADDKKRYEKRPLVDATGKPISFEQGRAEYVAAVKEAKLEHDKAARKIEDERDWDGVKGESTTRTSYVKIGSSVFQFNWKIESETNYEPEDPGERTAYYYDTLRLRVDPKAIKLA